MFFYDSLQGASVISMSDNNIKPRTPRAQPTGHTDSTATGFISTRGYQHNVYSADFLDC